MKRTNDLQTAWVAKDDEWLMIFGGEVPEVGMILERNGELIQVLAHGIRVTRDFGGTGRRGHENSTGACTWRVVTRPQRWDK